MPYHIEEEDGKFCVHKDDDGMNMGCHDTREEAEQQIAAIEANEDGKSSVQPEFKCFAVKAVDAELEGNKFRGIPSVMGNVDDGGDVIAPGAFKSALNAFLTEGIVPLGHDWMSLPVAIPMSARENGNKLEAEAEFHSTQAAQDARTVMQERLSRKKSVGLSIGFDIAPNGQHTFEDGEKMIEFLKDNKHDLNLFDLHGIKSYNGFWPLRLITKISRLFEFSIVSVPMNRLAVATAAKARVYTTEDFKKLTKLSDFEGFLRDAGFSRSAAIRFVSTLKGIPLPRDAGGDAPDPVEPPGPPAVTAGQEPPAEPVTPTESSAPFFWTADGKDYTRWMLLNN